MDQKALLNNWMNFMGNKIPSGPPKLKSIQVSPEVFEKLQAEAQTGDAVSQYFGLPVEVVPNLQGINYIYEER